MMIFLMVGTLGATNVTNILELWEIRDNLGDTYTLTKALSLEDTNPDTILVWSDSTDFVVEDIVKHPSDGFAYYCTSDHTSTSSFDSSKWTKMWECEKGWEPIGSESTPFHGNFDGGGFIISNLYINRGATDPANNSTLPPDGQNYVGLFGYVSNGSNATNANNSSDISIKNLGLTGVDITGKRGTGALIGKVLLPDVKKGKLVITENCYATGNVSGFGATGGLVGANNSNVKQAVPIIRYCYADVEVSSTHPNNTTINPNDPEESNGINPYNIKYGGLVGCNENGVTQDSYALGDVSGGDRVGGLTGCTIGGAIFRSYATGSVTQGIGSSAWEGGYGPITGRSDGTLPGVWVEPTLQDLLKIVII